MHKSVGQHDIIIPLLFLLFLKQKMEYFKSLFLVNEANPTVTVDEDNHIFRSYHAKDGLVCTPLYPKLSKNECTIARVWEETVKKNQLKPVFGHRPLIKVSQLIRAFVSGS